MPEIDLEIDRLLASGDWQQAAAILRHRGDLVRAQELFERAWDFENAAAVALERGDLLGQLRIALRRQDVKSAQRTHEALQSASPENKRRAAALFEQHHGYREAATLYEAVGELETARALYLRGGSVGVFHAARLDEKAGRLVEAARGYAAALHSGEGTAVERQRTALSHGRVLLRCGNLDEAVRSLQEARQLSDDSELLDEIEEQLVDCLVALGEAEIARPILTSYRSRRPPENANDVALFEPAEFVQRRAEATDREPRLLGRYRLQRLLGTGSMGRVYVATDEWQDREVAVKLLPLAASSSPAHANLYRRFCREAELLCGLRHPNLVELSAFHAAAGVLVMEYLPSGSLWSATLPLPLLLLRRLLAEVVDALLLVHSAGVLHRDIKPHNLFLSRSGAAKLADFGAATLRDIGLTQTEGLVGTLAYMAPEQLEGRDLSFATDVYGLAVTAFELCTGQLPFRGPDFIEQHLTAPPPNARTVRPSLPQPWAELLQRLLQKTPAARCTDLETLRREILSLPVPTLEDDRVYAHSDEPPSENPSVEASRQQVPALLRNTTRSSLFLTTDARLGRPMLVERFTKAVLQGERGAAHLDWLREMARLGGPGLQRILRIDLHNPSGVQIFFEAPRGLPVTAQAPLSSTEHAQLRRVLLRLHAAGRTHGDVAQSVMREPEHPLLLLCGHGPLFQAANARASDDLEALKSLAATTKVQPPG